MKFFTWIVLAIVSALFFYNCQSQNSEKLNREPQAHEDYLVVIWTPFGEMKAILYDETPQHKANFIKLVKEGFYDSLLFHRVIQGFMAQGGDPQSKGAKPFQPLGSGGLPYTIPAEIPANYDKKLFHRKGALAAARQGDNVNPQRASSSCQFYIVQGKVLQEKELENMRIDFAKMNEFFSKLLQMPEHTALRNQVIELQTAGDQKGLEKLFISSKNLVEQTFGVELDLQPFSKQQIAAYTTEGGTPNLDGAYTVFGQVVEGIDVIDKICAQPTGAGDRPKQDIPMKMRLEIIEKKKMAEKYSKYLQ